MEKINLYTRSGDYVTTVTMPSLRIMPEVLLWGERCFVRTHITADKWNYIEGLCYFVGPYSDEDVGRG